MIGGIEVKVCGMTRAEDAEAAASVGADFLGFIFYPKSPRNLSLEQFEKLLDHPAWYGRVAKYLGRASPFVFELFINVRNPVSNPMPPVLC